VAVKWITRFLNMMLTGSALIEQVGRRLSDDRLGIPVQNETRVVIDYSQPNIAKEMHVGHLRSTVIGDALARILGFQGARVIRHNHLGDWGTQFGMLIQYLSEHAAEWHPADDDASRSLSRLNQLYRDSSAKFDSDPEFADRARNRVVALQAGNPETLGAWQEIVAESKTYFNEVYDRLDVLLTDEDAVGESFYNPYLAEVAGELESSGIARISDGALCVFFDDVSGADGQPLPLIIRKSDGGFGYAATDLAALRYRTRDLGANKILYVVDARQALHFKMVFDTARLAGWLNDEVEAVHVKFGTVLGTDGKPFKTRSGETVRLTSLLDGAVAHARIVVAEKSGRAIWGRWRRPPSSPALAPSSTRILPPTGPRTTSSISTEWCHSTATRVFTFSTRTPGRVPSSVRPEPMRSLKVSRGRTWPSPPRSAHWPSNSTSSAPPWPRWRVPSSRTGSAATCSSSRKPSPHSSRTARCSRPLPPRPATTVCCCACSPATPSKRVLSCSDWAPLRDCDPGASSGQDGSCQEGAPLLRGLQPS